MSALLMNSKQETIDFGTSTQYATRAYLWLPRYTECMDTTGVACRHDTRVINQFSSAHNHWKVSNEPHTNRPLT